MPRYDFGAISTPSASNLGNFESMFHAWRELLKCRQWGDPASNAFAPGSLVRCLLRNGGDAPDAGFSRHAGCPRSVPPHCAAGPSGRARRPLILRPPGHGREEGQRREETEDSRDTQRREGDSHLFRRGDEPAGLAAARAHGRGIDRRGASFVDPQHQLFRRFRVLRLWPGLRTRRYAGAACHHQRQHRLRTAVASELR